MTGANRQRATLVFAVALRRVEEEENKSLHPLMQSFVKKGGSEGKGKREVTARRTGTRVINVFRR